MANEYVQMINDYIASAGLGGYVSDPYVLSVAIFAAGFLLSRIVLFMLDNFIKSITSKTKTDFDDNVLSLVRRPISDMLIIIALMAAIVALPLPEDDFLVVISINILLTAIYIIATLMLMGVIGEFIDTWGREWTKKTESTMDDALLPLFRSISNTSLVVIAVIVILGQWGVEVGPFLAGLGIAGIAIGFAVKDSLGNVFGGVSLMLDGTFKVGDKVEVDNGSLLGEIYDVGIRSTKVRTYDHEIVTIPNGILANSKIKNYTKPDHLIRVVVNFGVAYGSDVKKVKKVAMEAIKKIKGQLTDPGPVIEFASMGDFSLNFNAKFWLPDYAKQYSKKLEATERIHEALVENKIEIPFPTRTIHIAQEEAEKAKKRPRKKKKK